MYNNIMFGKYASHDVYNMWFLVVTSTFLMCFGYLQSNIKSEHGAKAFETIYLLIGEMLFRKIKWVPLHQGSIEIFLA